MKSEKDDIVLNISRIKYLPPAQVDPLERSKTHEPPKEDDARSHSISDSKGNVDATIITFTGCIGTANKMTSSSGTRHGLTSLVQARPLVACGVVTLLWYPNHVGFEVYQVIIAASALENNAGDE